MKQKVPLDQPESVPDWLSVHQRDTPPLALVDPAELRAAYNATSGPDAERLAILREVSRRLLDVNAAHAQFCAFARMHEVEGWPELVRLGRLPRATMDEINALIALPDETADGPERPDLEREIWWDWKADRFVAFFN